MYSYVLRYNHLVAIAEERKQDLLATVFINNLLHLLNHLMRQVNQELFYILLLAFSGVENNGFISVVLSPSPAY